MKTGFAGLGIMGNAMAANVINSGFDIIVYNRTISKTEMIKEKGAEICTNPAELGQSCETVILMLTGPAACDEVLWGEKGLLSESDPITKCIINMSTVTPDYAIKVSKKLKDLNINYIDCPVSGSKIPAEEGNLILLAGGEKELISKHERLLLSMGKRIINCGDTGMGSVMKLTVNILLGNMMSALSEAVNFGTQSGLKSTLIMETILSGPLGCGLYALKAPMFEIGEYPPQFPLKHIHKDMGFALQMAADKLSMPCSETSYSLYTHGIDDGFGDLDFAAVTKIIEAFNKK